MADVTLTYKGSEIAALSDSGTKTIQTGGKYCEGDIALTYVKPETGLHKLRIDFSAYRSFNETNDFLTAYNLRDLVPTSHFGVLCATFYNNTSSTRAGIYFGMLMDKVQRIEFGAVSRVGQLNKNGLQYGFDVYAGAYCIVEYGEVAAYV